MSKTVIKYLLITIILVAVGFAIGWYGRHFYAVAHTTTSQSTTTEIRENSSQYSFINPILYSNTGKSSYTEFKLLSDSLNAYISSSTTSHFADSVSVYFRDLDDGHWTGINEDEEYQPASMLKVAVMIAYLKHAYNDPSILSRKIYYQATSTRDQYYPPSTVLTSGYYTVDNLLRNMIIYSDNVAENLLANADPEDVVQLYKDLQLPPIPSDPKYYTDADFMSAKQYSTFFRALYNGTYLPWDLSEQALKLLSGTDFDGGIVSGVATGTVVAHKFGERTNKIEGGGIINRELHDCGIVYYPSKPYLLCVMTRGQSFPELLHVISDISKLTYDYVNKANK